MSFYTGGVDVGSTQTKAILINQHQQIVARAILPTGANVVRAAERAFEAVLQESGIDRRQVTFVVGTGYGRYQVKFGDIQVTEITCHARGAHYLFPATKTVIDMGGQDTKVIQVGEQGEVKDFVMNDKCAAGTGRFLAAAAEVVGLSLDDIGAFALKAKQPVRLSSVCAVFVESDIMSYLAQDKTVEDILGGVHSAIASRTISLARRVGVQPEITFTGGVSRNIGMIAALEEKLQMKLNVTEESHFAGALGAALFAMERTERSSFEGLPDISFHT